MKTKNTISIFLTATLLMTACSGNSDSANQSQVSQVAEKEKDSASVLPETKPEEPVVEELSPEEKMLNELKAKYTHVRAKYVDFEIGDLYHHMFKGEDGKEYDFCAIEDRTYELSVEDANSENGESINRKYKGKTFDIFYKVEKQDLLGWGQKEDVEVVKKMILVK